MKFRQLDKQTFPQTGVRSFIGLVSIRAVSELAPHLAEGVGKLLADRPRSGRGPVVAVYAALDRSGAEPAERHERFFMTQIHLGLEDGSSPVPSVDFVAITVTLQRPGKSGLETDSRDAVVQWLLEALAEALRAAGLWSGGRTCKVLAWRYGRPRHAFSISKGGTVRKVALPAGFDEDRLAFPPQPPPPPSSPRPASIPGPHARRLPGGAIHLSWEPVRGASGYTVDWYDADEKDWKVIEWLEGDDAKPGKDGRMHYDDKAAVESSQTYRLSALFGDLNEPEEVFSPPITVP